MINLTKGQRISLTKENGEKLKHICVGANWSAIQVKSFFGGTKTKDVDLDLSVGAFDAQGNFVEKLYFGNYRHKPISGMNHSGDDRTGDTDGDDGLDNEVVTIDIEKLPGNVAYLALVLNSYTLIDFKDIPSASVRIYEGTPSRVDAEFARFDITNNEKFAGSYCMILGALYRKPGADWKFQSIGEPTDDRDLGKLLNTVSQHYAGR
jgi:tellurium resistance protein TerZ